MPRWTAQLLLMALALAACDPASEARTTCEQFQEASCRDGCASGDACVDLWLAAAALDPEDRVETCVGGCPRRTCESDTFFDCSCYAECTRGATDELRQAILDAMTCDLESLPAECRTM